MPTHPRALVWALLLTAMSTFAQPVREGIDAYTKAVATAESAAAPGSIESALAAIDDLRDVLLARVPDGTLSVLESLPEVDFARLEALPGVFVQRIEVLVVKPVPSFFAALAARAGDEADLRFASALSGAYRNAKWPTYIEPQTDYSGCTAFGKGKLLEAYRLWSAMERDFPDRYVTAVSRERGQVQRNITRSTCACGDAVAVVREFEQIAATLDPADPIVAAVEERLSAVKEERSNIRFGCVSG